MERRLDPVQMDSNFMLESSFPGAQARSFSLSSSFPIDFGQIHTRISRQSSGSCCLIVEAELLFLLDRVATASIGKLPTPKLVFLAFPTNNKTHSMCTRMVFLSLSILTELDLSYPEESAYDFFSSS